MKPLFPKRQIVIRASTLHNAILCDQYTRYYYIDTLKKSIEYPQIAASYGTGFHRFAAELGAVKGPITKGAVKQCLRKPLEKFIKYTVEQDANLLTANDEWKSPIHLRNTCIRWARHCASGGDNFKPLTNAEGDIACEKVLRIPYYKDDYIEVILKLTIDRLGFYQDYENTWKPIFQDFKSTSNTKKDLFLTGFELNTQMSFYQFCLWWMMDKGLLPKEFEYTALQIIGIFIRKATKDNPVTSEIRYGERCIISKAKRELFKSNLDLLIGRLSNIVKDGQKHYLPNNCYANCTQKYGLCTYYEVCNNMKIADDLLMKYKKFDALEG